MRTVINNFYYGEEEFIFIALSELKLKAFVPEKKWEWQPMARNCNGKRGDNELVTIDGAEEINQKIFKENRELIEEFKKEIDFEGAVSEKTFDEYNFKLTPQYAEFEKELKKLEKEENELLEQLDKVEKKKAIFGLQYQIL